MNRNTLQPQQPPNLSDLIRNNTIPRALHREDRGDLQIEDKLKLGLNSLVGLVHYAIRHGIVNLQDSS